MLKKGLIILLLIISIPLFAGDEIVGYWIVQNEEIVDTFTFNADGTGVWTYDDSKVVDTFVYELGADTITMIWESNGETTVYGYILEASDTLILGIDFGYGDGYTEWIYQRVE